MTYLLIFFLLVQAIFSFGTRYSTRYIVYDNILSDKICNLIDQEAVNGGLGHTVYDRSIKPRSCTESTCNNILNKLGDTSKYIEYWWRDEWIHLDCHKDCDEYLAKVTTPPEINYPNNGHVLYLDIGSNVYGPTCLFFENKSSLIEEIAIIPAVKGRLLRFDGNIMHAVPRPALGYLDPEGIIILIININIIIIVTITIIMSIIFITIIITIVSIMFITIIMILKDGGSNLEIWSRTKRVPGVVDEESTIFRRSVLLFNTWNNIPIGIDTNIPSGTETFNKKQDKTNFDELGINKDWNNIDLITNQEDIKNIHLKVMLLGNSKERRGRLSRRIDLRGPIQVKDGLLDNKIPSYFKVYEE